MDYAEPNEWTGSAIALQGPGGVRAGLVKGDIIYADLVTTTPFENKILSVEIPGSTIRSALEYSVSNPTNLRVLQVSGVKVTYDLSRNATDRIIELKVLCQACEIPRYENIDDSKYYRVALADYIANGGDGFQMFPNSIRNIIEGPKDVDALADYIEKISPISSPGLIGRITFVKNS